MFRCVYIYTYSSFCNSLTGWILLTIREIPLWNNQFEFDHTNSSGCDDQHIFILVQRHFTNNIQSVWTLRQTVLNNESHSSETPVCPLFLEFIKEGNVYLDCLAFKIPWRDTITIMFFVLVLERSLINDYSTFSAIEFLTHETNSAYDTALLCTTWYVKFVTYVHVHPIWCSTRNIMYVLWYVPS